MTLVGAVLIIAGLSVGLASLVALHLLPTGMSPVHNAVSQYGITAYHTGYRIQTIAYAAAGLGAALGIGALPGPVGAAVACCAVFAVARALISWSPMDAPGSARTPTGRRHVVLAAAAFLAVALGGSRLSTLLDRDGLHPAIATASSALAAAMAAALLGMLLSGRSGLRYFGAIERMFYALMTVWLAAVAVLLIA